MHTFALANAIAYCLTLKLIKMGLIKYSIRQGKNLKTEKPMYYGAIAPVNPITMEQIAEEVEGATTATRADVLAVISALEWAIIKNLSNGKATRLGLIGSFCPTLRSQSTESLQEFKTNCIEKIAVQFTPSSTFRYKTSADNPDNSFARVDQ